MRAESTRRVSVKAPRPSPEADAARLADKSVFLIDLAAYTGRTLCALSEKARRLGCRVYKLRRPNSGKAALAVSAADGKRIIESDTPAAKPSEILDPKDLFI